MKKEILVGLTALLMNCNPNSTPKYDTTPAKVQLAQCLVKQKATMYGAYWCPACYVQEQKIFGPEAWEVFKVNYVECSDKSSQEELKRCEEVVVDGKISLPTWKFNGGTVIIGYQSLEQLAELSKCD